MSGNRKSIILLASILTVAILFFLWQSLCFKGTSYYRKLIAEADSVVITYYILNPEKYGEVAVTITDKELLGRLANSIKLQWFWLPDNRGMIRTSSFRIRTFRNGEHNDIIVIQHGYIRENVWIVSVDNKLVATIKELVKESGGTLPDLGKILEREIYSHKEDGEE
jgi:hypothetical protein